MAAKEHKKQFKAEIKQLLDIITHSIYTNHEIFLRELVSNASDALDKLRFLTAGGHDVADADAPLEIRINADADAGVLTIEDTGLGMTADELVANIGTIAHSGSAQFMKEAEASGESLDNIIGRFGVGFYSVFMVADKVVITTRSATPDASPMSWTSSGTGSYTMQELDGDAPRGTKIEIHLKEEAKKYAEERTIKDILHRHSNFINFPIMLADEQVNTQPALWREPKFKIKKEQYDEFYSFLTLDQTPPLETLHIAVDAPVQFTSLVFIPASPSNSLFDNPDNYGLDLYVRRVLIERKHKALIPEYLGFTRGLVDTEDLPLNLSRETLQQNLLVDKIKTTITKQVLAQLAKLTEDKERYAQFWTNHNKVFKLGYSDYINRDKFAELLRFNSSTDEDAQGLTSLAEYAERMKEGQKAIYYVSGPSREAVRLDPHLEIFTQRGLEVLYLYEPIDEFIMDALGKYKDFDLVAAEQADIGELEKFETVDEDEVKPEALNEEDAKTFEGMLSAIKEILGERVEDVRESKRLKGSAACLVTPDGAMSSQMQKYMQLMVKDSTPPVRVMELNRDHPLTRNLLRIFKSDAGDDFLKSTVEQLYESALLMDGYLNDPHAMVGRINTLLEQASGWYAEIKKA
ncbi:molecular chaperone HtpG [Desulfovibrio ferrophilus]|uniref:Chaperone protein HtpG n=1 Tax=Desulfovibrio ferrophilus TaxID=241368 RepID=A0A2Z6B0M5_9BACT|nr:molecular chaperone HtpG [Desulfovibrio ferrophilus]BBD08998.1 heat shock protein Hsp90 [Desulfovibrio ferrophilus]